MTEDRKNLLIGIGFLACLVMIGKAVDVIWPDDHVESKKAMQSGAQYLGIGEFKAFEICKKILVTAAKFPDKSEIPSVDNMSQDSDSEYYFSWGSQTKHVMLMNGMGMMVPASASCILDKMTGNPVNVTLNGTSILSVQHEQLHSQSRKNQLH